MIGRTEEIEIILFQYPELSVKRKTEIEMGKIFRNPNKYICAYAVYFS